MRHKYSSILLSMMLALSFWTGSAFSFDEKSAAVSWIMDSGVSNGVAPGEYGAEYPASWAQVETFCNRTFGTDFAEDRTAHITIEDTCAVILSGIGVVDAPSFLGDHSAAAEIARLCGIIPDGIDPLRYATRGEAAEILYRVVHGDYVIPDMGFPVVAEDGYLGHPLQVMPYLMELYRLPPPVLEAYHATLSIGNDYVDAWNDMTGSGAVGVCFYSTGHIAVTAPEYIIHEMGHFWDLHHGFPGEIEALYREEADALAEAIGWDYCTVNRDEFYAESFAAFIRDPDRLRVCAPKIYKAISDSLDQEV